MPLQDLVTGRRYYGPKEMTCLCGHEPEWHKRMNRVCGKCDRCPGFKIAAQYRKERR